MIICVDTKESHNLSMPKTEKTTGMGLRRSLFRLKTFWIKTFDLERFEYQNYERPAESKHAGMMIKKRSRLEYLN